MPAVSPSLVAEAGCKVRHAEKRVAMTGIMNETQLYPALKLAHHELPDHVHALVAVVQTWDIGELLAAVMFEDFSVFLRNFLQSFEAIGRETRRDDRDAPHTIF